ncbi:MAG: hydrogenase maturation protease [Dehalococcoidales bacterium]
MKTLIVGLGNPILTDDGIGPEVAKELQSRLDPLEATIVECSLGGLNMLDLLTGYDRAIIIDAIETEGGEAGQIYQLDATALDATRHGSSIHELNLTTALELGKKLGMALPREISIFAIEVADTNTFSEKCTSAVQSAVPRCVELVINELKKDSIVNS